ncbi:hypothetical protein H4S14_002931 [Agrobacterium vitis]|nr:hypothetical protein [Agrobacterium vitis]MBE1439169.1 hypothetical protein [Agrobacterium vitis]
MTRHKRTIHSHFETLRFAIRTAQGNHSYFRTGYGALEQLAMRPWQSLDRQSRS